MKRRTFLKSVGGGLVVGCLAGRSGGEEGSARRPNVLLIITDDQGYGDLGCHGNPVLKTPCLDRLHGESVRFTHFCAGPVCSPTRAGLMTGRYHYRTGVVDTYAGRAMMDPRERTLPEMLGAAGYRTGIFGKWHLGDNYPLRPVDRGFQESLVHFGGGISQPSDPEFYERKNTYFDTVLSHNGKLEKAAGYCSDVFSDAAIRFIRENREVPFFAYLAYNAPHTPLQVPDSDAEPYVAAGLNPDLARFYGMLTNMDRNIGRVLAALEDSGVARDTMVIFLSDNGGQSMGKAERFNAGLRDWKGSVYDGGLRVPFWVRWPAALTAGLESDRIGLLPAMRDTAAAKSWPDRTLFFQWHRGDVPVAFKNCAARTQRWKLVNGAELYDMIADPGEKKDLAAEHPDVVGQLRGEYEKWFADVGAARGYDPVRVRVGNDRQNPVTFSRQDWRGSEDWSRKENIGYWEIHVERGGDYSIAVDFEPGPEKSEVRLRVSGLERARSAEPNSASVKLDGLRLPQGDTRLECWIQSGDKRNGVRFVTVTRNGD